MQRLLGITLFLSLAACGSEAEIPTEIAGTYAVSITSEANGCNFVNWSEGKSNTGLSLVVMQEMMSPMASANVDGLSALFQDLLLGSHVFSGDVHANGMTLQLEGSKEHKQGACTFRVNATLRTTLDGDNMQGHIIYTMAPSDLPDCAQMKACESVQSILGSRPETLPL